MLCGSYCTSAYQWLIANANWFNKTTRLTGIPGAMLTFFSARLKLQECLNPDIRLDYTWGETAKNNLFFNLKHAHTVRLEKNGASRTTGYLSRLSHQRERHTTSHGHSRLISDVNKMEINKFLHWEKKEVYTSLNERIICCHQLSFLIFWDPDGLNIVWYAS